MSFPVNTDEPAATAFTVQQVSVCICTRNRPESLIQTLESVQGSETPVHQIVVSDDSTDDRTALAVGEHYPDITYCRGPRTGLGANRNRAIEAATGDVILFLDDDCLLGADFLAAALARLGTALEPTKTIVNGRETNGGRIVVSSDQNFLGFQNRSYSDGDSIRSVVINAALFPRRLFGEVRFDENLIYGCDEIDLTTRAVAKGYRIVSCPEAINHHFPSPVNRDYYGTHANASRIYVTFKRYRWTERRPGKALLFLAAATIHLCVSMAKEHGLAGVRVTPGILAEALRPIRRRGEQ